MRNMGTGEASVGWKLRGWLFGFHERKSIQIIFGDIKMRFLLFFFLVIGRWWICFIYPFYIKKVLFIYVFRHHIHFFFKEQNKFENTTRTELLLFLVLVVWSFVWRYHHLHFFELRFDSRFVFHWASKLNHH